MTDKKVKKPDFYKTLMQEGFFPGGNKITKYQESENYWMFRTGSEVYKIKKPAGEQSAISLEEVFCQEVARLVSLHSPGLNPRVMSLKTIEGQLQLSQDLVGADYYMVVMDQLADRYFLNEILDKDKATTKHMQRLAEFLDQFHKSSPKGNLKQGGNPEELGTYMSNLFYQSKKHLGYTITQPMIDTAQHPMEKFLKDANKLLLKRVKKGHFCLVHGCFIPRKINISKEAILCLGKSYDPLKNRYADMAKDVVDLVVELNHRDKPELSQAFVEHYVKVSHDKELTQVLPLFHAIKSLNQGLRYSLISKNGPVEDKESNKQTAQRYYEQMIKVVRSF